MKECIVRKTGGSAMRSPLAWALLGLVIERPSYGYELAQRFQRVYGDMLVLSNVLHVYRLLESLSNHSLIEEIRTNIEEPAITGQPKPHYRASPLGVRAYNEWLVSQLDEERRRSWLFAREIGMLAPETALTVIERYESEWLNEPLDTATGPGAPAAEGADHIAERLAEEEERLALGVRLSWLKYARGQLNAVVEGGHTGGVEREAREPVPR
jgi:DNA-binding PadR family transcriptional regulator